MSDVIYEYGCEITSTSKCPLREEIRAEVIEEFHKTKIEVLNWLIKRQSEGYGTTNGELLDYIYDYKLKEQNK